MDNDLHKPAVSLIVFSFPDFFIPEFPGMKTARFPGNPRTANSRRCSIIVHYNGHTHGGFDCCCCSSSMLVVRGEDEEHNVNTIPWRGPPPLSTCSSQSKTLEIVMRQPVK